METLNSLNEREQREWIFQIMETARHNQQFYADINNLIKQYQKPYTDEGIIRVLNPKVA